MMVRAKDRVRRRLGFHQMKKSSCGMIGYALTMQTSNNTTEIQTSSGKLAIQSGVEQRTVVLAQIAKSTTRSLGFAAAFGTLQPSDRRRSVGCEFCDRMGYPQSPSRRGSLHRLKFACQKNSAFVEIRNLPGHLLGFIHASAQRRYLIRSENQR